MQTKQSPFGWEGMRQEAYFRQKMEDKARDHISKGILCQTRLQFSVVGAAEGSSRPDQTIIVNMGC